MGHTNLELEHPQSREIELAAVLHALSDPQRLQIVRELAADSAPKPCGAFMHLGVAKSTLTHHFRVLREAGVLRMWREGTTKQMEIRRDDLEARLPGLLDAVLAGAEAKVPASA